MGEGPLCRRDELLKGGVKGSEIGFVASAPLIHHGIKLEVNLVQPTCELNCEGSAILARCHTTPETAWQTPLKKVGWSCEPAFRKSKVAADAIPRLLQSIRQRISRTEVPVFGQSHDIHVSGWPRYDPSASKADPPITTIS